RFGYRQSPRPLDSASTSVRRQAPAPYFSDEISMTLDIQGRLLYFSKISPEKLGPASSSPAPNWSGFWDAADLDATALTPVAPTWMPDVGADQLFSWKGVKDGQTFDVHAASYRGAPVFFKIMGVDEPATRLAGVWVPGGSKFAAAFFSVVATIAIALCVFF